MKKLSPVKRFLLRWICILGGLYLFIVIAAMFAENTLIFIGAGKHTSQMGPRFEEKQIDVNGDVPSQPTMTAFWLPKQKGPTDTALIFFCGNGGNYSTSGVFAQEVQKHLDCGVLIVDYPGYGRNDGKPSEAGCYANAAAGIDWLIKDRKIPAEKIIVLGQSLGGGVAVEMATRYPVRALVVVSSYTSLPDAAKARFPFLPTHLLMKNRFDSIAKIGIVHSPVFISHGTRDDTIPYAQGEKLFAAANEPKRFMRMEGHTHNDCLNPDLLSDVAKFLQDVPALEPAK